MTATLAGHPDEEEFGRYLEGSLPTVDRADFEDHVADCQRCYALLVESGLGLEALTPDTTPRPVAHLEEYRTGRGVVPAATSSTRWWLAAAAAIAAVLVAAVYFRPAATTGPRLDLAVTQLVDAVGSDRFLDGRLSVPFSYGPQPTVTRSVTGQPTARPEVRAAAAHVAGLAADGTTSSTRIALGVALLAQGQIDRAVALLEDAARQDPANAALQSDLAAAFLESRRVGGDPDGAARAVEAAERATTLAPERPEGWFNLALACEATLQTSRAVSALERLERIEPNSSWVRELRTRLGEARQP